MLVLSRKTGQKIVIDNQITITIVKIKGNTIRIGIDAPTTVPVHRQEYLDKQEENDEST